MNHANNDDHLLVFVVKSRRGKADYRVDLSDWNGHGACDCPHFLCKLQPKIRNGDRGRHLMCYHIKEARDLLADNVIAKIIESETEEPQF